MATEEEQRRKSDVIIEDVSNVTQRTHARIRELTDGFLALKGEQDRIRVVVNENTDLLHQIRDILTTFRVAGAFCKAVGKVIAWTSAFVAGALAIYHGWHK